jgi:two-component system, sensor histidine kinase and response regulator
VEQILVINNQADLKDNLAELLRAERYIVYVAADGKRGIEMAKLGLPDLIICNLDRSETNSFEVLRNLASFPETRSIPIVFLTGSNDPEIRCKNRNFGADDYLVKPFDKLELLCTIKNRLNKRNLLKSCLESDRLAYARGLESAIYDLSHVVREPVCSLLGLINLLQLDENMPEADRKQILLKIRESVLTLDAATHELTQRMLDVFVKNKIQP